MGSAKTMEVTGNVVAPNDSPFGFTEDWFAIGVITPERLAVFGAEWERGEDPFPEHYRWRAFLAFLEEHRPLQPDLAVALYELGEADPDKGMGSSMMDTLVRLPECPKAILDAATKSGRPHLIRLVERRRDRTGF